MSTMGDVVKVLKDVVMMNERIEQLTAITKELERENRDMRERLVRVETIIEIASRQGGSHQRAIPPTIEG